MRERSEEEKKMGERKMKKCIHFRSPHLLFSIFADRRFKSTSPGSMKNTGLPVYPIEVF